MTRRCRILAVVGVMVSTCLPMALADGGMFISAPVWSKHREWSMINEPEQKAVVYFHNGVEDLIISPSYQGPTSDFAWVVPVPAKPKVSILKGAIFHELGRLTTLSEHTANSYDGDTLDAAAPRKKAVTVIERKTVGAYDVSVLSSTDGQALVKWLKANKYHVPEKALVPINTYVKKKWTFVACRVKGPKAKKGLSTGTLAPLRMTFKAQDPIYPMRLSSVNPKPFKVLVYLMVPAENLRFVTVDHGYLHRGMWRYTSPIKNAGEWLYSGGEVAKNQREYPTIRKVSRREMSVFVEEETIKPADCTVDYVWKIPSK